jgi:hypothetical protein
MLKSDVRICTPTHGWGSRKLTSPTSQIWNTVLWSVCKQAVESETGYCWNTYTWKRRAETRMSVRSVERIDVTHFACSCFQIFHGTLAFRDLRQRSFVSHPPIMAFCLPSSTIYTIDPIHIQSRRMLELLSLEQGYPWCGEK